MEIVIKNVRKAFKDLRTSFQALDDVSLYIRSGELIALLGPSGSGKTSLLRVISGLETPDSGSVRIDGVETVGQTTQERGVGFVFQHYALFRHMTVFDNIAFGLTVKKESERPSAEEIREKVIKLLELVHLPGLENRFPSQLSGGQRQRVALARALAVDPRVLLLDEPFGALDAKVRKELRRWLRKLHEDMGITTIFVTHDQEEAMEVADRVVVMNQGKIEQEGTPEFVYHNPVNSFVYDFLGNYNSFYGRKEKDGSYTVLPATKKNAASAIIMFARPHDMDVARQMQDKDSIPARILHINPAGPLVSIDFEDRAGNMLQAALPKEKFRELDLSRGDEIFLKPRELRVFE